MRRHPHRAITVFVGRRERFLGDKAIDAGLDALRNLIGLIEAALEIGSADQAIAHDVQQASIKLHTLERALELYKNAYRHFVMACRLYAHNIFYIWSPVGDNGCERYWPGSAFADFVGLSVFGFPQFDLRYYHKVRSFSEQMDEKYRRIAAFQKPVIIAEFGVTGGHDFQQAWLRAALQDMKRVLLAQDRFLLPGQGYPWGLGSALCHSRLAN